MITRAEIEKLDALHVVEPAMLSLYLAVPSPADPAALTATSAAVLGHLAVPEIGISPQAVGLSGRDLSPCEGICPARRFFSHDRA
jgi:hypothetical protein